MSIPKIAPYSMEAAAKLPANRISENKVSWSIDPKKAVLLIHDMQVYFTDFYQADMEPMNVLIENIRALKASCKSLNIPIIYTAQPGNQNSADRALLTDFWGSGLKDDPKITRIVKPLSPTTTDIQYKKWRYSAFKRTPLKQYMIDEKKSQLIVCGIYAHIGILATSLDAFMEDIQTTVIADAVADFSLKEHQSALKYIAQRCGQITNMKSVLRELDSNREKLNLMSMRKDVSQILSLPINEIEPDENLMYLGLDSIRLMTLLEIWREKGAQISFIDLAQSTTLTQWWNIISTSKKNEG